MNKGYIETLIQDVLNEEINKRYNYKYESISDLDETDLDESDTDLEEDETSEGNEFSLAVKNAKDAGKDEFMFKGEKYPVKESKKWIQDIDMKKNELHKKLGIPENEKIPKTKLRTIKRQLEDKAKGKKKLSESDLKLLNQVNLALKLKKINERVELTENELIDLIENIIIEEKNNIKVSAPQGLQYTEKSQKESKNINDDNVNIVTKKLKQYIKNGSKGNFEMNPKQFPKGNGELGEMSKKAYKASNAVEEYIEAFAYPGLEETRPDEIKGNEQWMEDNIKGSSKTGNGDWANSVKTDLGEKINKKRKEKPYQKEKDKSYNRVTQPVDEAGEGKGQDKLDKMFVKLESREDKKEKLISEDIIKMKNLISYNSKTQ